MPGVLVVAYLLIEIVAFIAVAHYWSIFGAILLVLASTGLGTVMAMRGASRAMAGSVRGRAGDAALAAGAVALLLVPGIVTGALGLLLLIPPVRTAVRPVIGAVIKRSFPAVTAVSMLRRRTMPGADPTADPGTPTDGQRRPRPDSPPGGEVIDGEVIEGEVLGDEDGDDPYPGLDRY